MKYEKKNAPTHAARAANNGEALVCSIIGAQIDEAVTIATVPEPWIKRTTVATMNGNKITGIFQSTIV